MLTLSRRAFSALLGAAAVLPQFGLARGEKASMLRIRTITAGIELAGPSDSGALGRATDFLETAKARFGELHTVQTTRIATQPLARYMPNWMSAEGIAALAGLDRIAADAGVMFSVGPALTQNRAADGFGDWAAECVSATSTTSFSAFIASRQGGVHPQTAKAAAQAVIRIAKALPRGEGNFRFCATALCPPGAPFFPAAYHEGEKAFSIGLEPPRLMMSALQDGQSLDEAAAAMRAALNDALAPIQDMAERLSRETGWRYLGIDTSPAPGPDASIGAVIEKLSGAAFGAPSTLSACAAITDVLKGLSVKTCGYSGLMLPVLEDRVLAERVMEDRYGVSELLLYSTVCGTGLDVVPLAGAVSEEALTATMGDVGALALRHDKPLSVRVLPVPGVEVGEAVDFENPFLVPCKAMAL